MDQMGLQWHGQCKFFAGRLLAGFEESPCSIFCLQWETCEQALSRHKLWQATKSFLDLVYFCWHRGARDLCDQAFTQHICPIWSEASAFGKHPSVHVGCLSYGCRVDSSVYQSFHAGCSKFSLRIWPGLSLHSLVLTMSCQSQKLIFWESRFKQLADSQASACGKHLSVPKGYLSCSCTVDSCFAPIFL